MKPDAISAAALRAVLSDELLLRVQKPSRYLGTEYNAVHKDPGQTELRVALVFPDLYDLGLGNLGLLILYAILNQRPWCWAERAYAPAPDMEAVLRERGLPLFTNESKTPLSQMDLVGFTLQSELTFTNVLNVLDLAGIPLHSTQRSDRDPLIAAGGPAAFNPEPLASFMDFFVIGDGEEAVVEVADLLRGMRAAPRAERLEAVSRIEGVYVPALYATEELPDGRVLPRAGGPRVTKRVVADLDVAAFPTNYIVPYTQQVHDRIGLEVLRGCTRGCRFCQAGMVTRPVRERSLPAIDELIQRTFEATGYEELSLLSLSTCDYPRPGQLVRQAAERAAKGDVSVALPSLRLDSFSVGLADLITGVRRSGLTFAPEAATPRLRAVINKWIPDDVLIDTAVEAFRRGWGHVKVYFMIGLPGERDEDVDAIVDLCVRTLEAGRKVNPKARLHTGVSTFVPKPCTPFQWAQQIPPEEARRRQDILKEGFRRHLGIKFGRHNVEETFIEGLIARGDRRTGDLLEAAWRNGARLDAWDELRNWDAWMRAVDGTGYDVAAALAARNVAGRLPWDHIDVLVSKDWLRREWDKALAGQHAEDCRYGSCNDCGVNEQQGALCVAMRRASAEGRSAEEAQDALKPFPAPVEPNAVQRLRIRIGRSGEARFLSHLELVSAWTRALRRARAPLSHTQGFHAHPRVTFATAPPVGEESVGDLMDVVLRERVEPGDLLERLRAALPTGFAAYDLAEVALKGPALMASVTGFSYTFWPVSDSGDLAERIAAVLASDKVLVERAVKPKRSKGRRGRPDGKTRRLNIRPMIADLTVGEDNGRPIVSAQVRLVENRGLKPRELMELLGLDPVLTRFRKEETHLVGESG